MEEWIKWEPLQNLAHKYDIEFICTGPDEFKIIMMQMIALKGPCSFICFFLNSILSIFYEKMRGRQISCPFKVKRLCFFVNDTY